MCVDKYTVPRRAPKRAKASTRADSREGERCKGGGKDVTDRAVHVGSTKKKQGRLLIGHANKAPAAHTVHEQRQGCGGRRWIKGCGGRHRIVETSLTALRFDRNFATARDT